MATYFNASDEADKLLISEEVRAHSDLYSVAAQVEMEVIEYFTSYCTVSAPVTGAEVVEKTVELRGYNADSALAEAGLKDALRRTIADVVSHRLQYYDTDETLTSVRRGSRAWTRENGAVNKDWPKNRWDWRLIPYDKRDPIYYR